MNKLLTFSNAAIFSCLFESCLFSAAQFEPHLGTKCIAGNIELYIFTPASQPVTSQGVNKISW